MLKSKNLKLFRERNIFEYFSRHIAKNVYRFAEKYRVASFQAFDRVFLLAWLMQPAMIYELFTQ